jgi:hypothetical protein
VGKDFGGLDKGARLPGKDTATWIVNKWIRKKTNNDLIEGQEF